jgi:ATP-dependent protease Clp ATPase subunit
MKKILKISLVSMLVAMPMIAGAAPVAGEPVAGNANSPTATSTPKYALKGAGAGDGNTATAGYVKGAYNAVIKGINNTQDEIDTLNTGIDTYSDAIGHLTDGKGRTVDFKNTFIILTSNLITGADQNVMDTLRNFFKPEFLNRLDEILVFNPLGKEAIRRIVDIQTERLQQRLNERHITLQLDDKAKDWLAENGYNPDFGARPLKRLLVQNLENPLAMMLLDGAVDDNSKVVVSADSDGLRLTPQ